MADRRLALATIVGSALCLGYFELHLFGFSGGRFAAIFRRLLVLEDARTAWLMLPVCLAAAAWRRSRPVLRLVDALAAHATAAAALFAAVLGAAAIVVYHRHPLSMDEYSALFQARVFAAGHLVARLPPSMIDWLVVPGFNGSFLFASRETGRAIEQYLPGFALLLAPFARLGVPWLCNPVLSGAALVLMYRITLDITGERRAAGWALLFGMGSAVFWADGISYYAMQAHLTLNLLFARLLLQPARARAVAAGVVGSLALVLHNPVPHALFAAPWAWWLLRGTQRRRFLPWLALGYLPLTALLGGGWLALRTSIAGSDTPASVLAVTAGAVLHWPDLKILDMRLAGLVKLWIWAVPGLYLLAAIGWARLRDQPAVRLLAQSAVLTFGGYLFVNLDQGHGWGYRYFHGAFGVIPILAACALSARADAEHKFAAFAGAAAVLGLALLVPLQMQEMRQFIARHLAQLPPPRRPGNDVYFIDARGGYYAADLIQSDPELRGPDLRLASRGPRWDAELMRQNWPAAVRVGRTPWVEQWYLGPAEQRRVPPGTHAAARFSPTFDVRQFGRPAVAPGGLSLPMAPAAAPGGAELTGRVQ